MHVFDQVADFGQRHFAIDLFVVVQNISGVEIETQARMLQVGHQAKHLAVIDAQSAVRFETHGDSQRRGAIADFRQVPINGFSLGAVAGGSRVGHDQTHAEVRRQIELAQHRGQIGFVQRGSRHAIATGQSHLVMFQEPLDGPQFVECRIGRDECLIAPPRNETGRANRQLDMRKPRRAHVFDGRQRPQMAVTIRVAGDDRRHFRIVENALGTYNWRRTGKRGESCPWAHRRDQQVDQQVTEDSPVGSAQDWLDEAVRRNKAGELEQGAPSYEHILRLDPGHPAALYHFGTLEIARSNVAAGIELLRLAASKCPDAAEIHQSLGMAYKTLGQWGNAAQAFERALATNPEFAAAYFELADLSQTLGSTDAAIDFYRRAINLDPSHTEAFRRLGDILYARENWLGAENCFARVCDTGLLNDDPPAYLEILNRLGIALLKQEKLDGAAH